MDFGWVQFTEAKILAEYIKTDAYKMEVRPASKESSAPAYLADLAACTCIAEPR